jgi:hypothetical protein
METIDAPIIPVEDSAGRVVVGVVCEDLTSKADAWTNDKVAEVERNSIEVWASVPEDQQRAIAVIARDCLIRLMENPLEWLPTSLLPETGTKMGLFVFINFDDVEAHVVKMREQAELELQTQVVGISQLREELKPRQAEPVGDGGQP